MSYCWRTPKSRKFAPIDSFFEHREPRKSYAERIALGIEIGWPTVSVGFLRQLPEKFQGCNRGAGIHSF